MKDFFVSYNGQDREWAEWIAWELEELGYTTILQAWDFRPGNNFIMKMQQASEQSKRTVAVLSPHYLNGLYSQPEWAAAFKRDPTGSIGLLIPIRIVECVLEGMLASVVYVDFVGCNEPAARYILTEAVTQKRGKPTIRPSYPGEQTKKRPLFPGAQDSIVQSLEVKKAFQEEEVVNSFLKTKEQVIGIEVTIDRSLSEFDEQEQKKLLEAFEKFLDIGTIKLTRKRSGSVKLYFELPSDKAKKLFWAIRGGIFEDEYKVIDAELVTGSKNLLEEEKELIQIPKTVDVEPDRTISVWIVDGNREYRETLWELLNSEQGLMCTHTFANNESMLETLRFELVPDVILMDLEFSSRMSGADSLMALRKIDNEIRVVMLTNYADDDNIFDALCAGANGYLLKMTEPEKIIEAVTETYDGGFVMSPQVARRVLTMFTHYTVPNNTYSLTKRELEVLELLVDGLKKREIADQLFIGFSTIDTHMRNIYKKLHVHSRTEAVVKALRERLL